MPERLSIDQLAEASIRLIAWNQHPLGGFAASPLFSHYAFSWLRDGSFIAYGMDRAGEHQSAAAFYEWVNRIIERKRTHIDDLLAKHRNNEWIGQNEYLHTRYHLDGRDDEHSQWGHFQLDGYGTWLWGLGEHLKQSGWTTIPENFQESVSATVSYLLAFWRLPNFDCWEEYADFIHPSTLACIYGGLQSIAGFDEQLSVEINNVCEEIQQFLLQHAVHPEGHFVKNILPYEQDGQTCYRFGNEGVDGSLFWLCEPFQVFPPSHPAMASTIERIISDLRTTYGGIRRYAADTYYGGGEWLLLTAWYGWVEYSRGNAEAANEALQWVASKADSLGRMPEQVPDALLDRGLYEEWVSRWGTPALPLLWSHAMFLVLYHQLK